MFEHLYLARVTSRQRWTTQHGHDQIVPLCVILCQP
eukprot:UN18816